MMILPGAKCYKNLLYAGIIANFIYTKHTKQNKNKEHTKWSNEEIK